MITLGDATQLVIYVWNKFLTLLFSNMTFDGGVSVGWIIIGVGLIGMLLATILSRPISESTLWAKIRKEDDDE